MQRAGRRSIRRNAKREQAEAELLSRITRRPHAPATHERPITLKAILKEIKDGKTYVLFLPELTSQTEVNNIADGVSEWIKAHNLKSEVLITNAKDMKEFREHYKK